ncbi:MAG: hypothetical protein ACK54F_03480 [Planctomycetia bacterium]|jgi:hypothetical protein
MDASTLRTAVTATGSHFFDAATMRFFGDRMGNYYVAKHPVTITKRDGSTATCWELRRRKPVKFGQQGSCYFNIETYERVMPAPWNETI